MTYAMAIAGLVLLGAGGESLVRGAVALARRMRISRLLIGLTVVSFGTSAPELIVSIQSAVGGHPDIAVGNVVGSNIANIALILGLSALVRPISVDRKDVGFDMYVAIAASAALLLLGFLGHSPGWVGALLVASLVWYTTASYLREVRAGAQNTDWHAEAAEGYIVKTRYSSSVLQVGIGLVALVFGADLLIKGASAIALDFGVPEAAVALTVVALGTSLPELVTSVIAIRRGHVDVAIGNVFGSNIFNILLILGTTSMLARVDISVEMATVHIPFMVLLTIAASVVLMWRDTVGRVIGLVFLLTYCAYVVAAYIM